jgi:hypothetical protein
MPYDLFANQTLVHDMQLMNSVADAALTFWCHMVHLTGLKLLPQLKDADNPCRFCLNTDTLYTIHLAKHPKKGRKIDMIQL